MDINDILVAPDGVKRPDHPDFWVLSETVLKLKGQVAAGEGEDVWRANYEAIGDFDSIAYCAIQCGFDLFGINDGADWAALMRDGRKHESYVKAVQAFFDGFVLGATLREKHEDDARIVTFSVDDVKAVVGRKPTTGERRDIAQSLANNEVLTEIVTDTFYTFTTDRDQGEPS